MKICHITSAHSRYDTRIFKRQCKSLSNAGHEVLLVCCDGKNDENIDGVTIKSYSSIKLSMRQRALFLLKNKMFISYLVDIDADIYQFHDFELIELGRKLKNKGKHVIFDSHENWHGIISKHLPKNNIIINTLSFFLNLYYSRVLNQFDAVFTVSPNLVKQFSKFTKNVFFVSNYPSIQCNYNYIETTKENLFIYAGTVYDISNQINTTLALSKIQTEIKYNIVGNISSKLKNLILSTNGNEKVVFTNWVKKNELEILLSKSIAGLIILDYDPICCNKEGQLGSNKIFEYMLAGLPVICTDFSLWKELIIDKYKCGICVNPNDVDSIYNAMTYILNNIDEAKEMGKRGKNAIYNEFNWEKDEVNYIERYEKIFNSN